MNDAVRMQRITALRELATYMEQRLGDALWANAKIKVLVDEMADPDLNEILESIKKKADELCGWHGPWGVIAASYPPVQGMPERQGPHNIYLNRLAVNTCPSDMEPVPSFKARRCGRYPFSAVPDAPPIPPLEPVVDADPKATFDRIARMRTPFHIYPPPPGYPQSAVPDAEDEDEGTAMEYLAARLNGGV